MFIYIAACDMFPELVEMGIEIEKSGRDENKFSFYLKIQIILIQNIGILTGILLMFILAAYSKLISL
jgi:hypothetical protein